MDKKDNSALVLALAALGQSSSAGATAISLDFTASDGHLTASLLDSSGIVISSSMVDLPTELIVESGYYDADEKEVVLVLANSTHSEIRIPVGDLITDLERQINLKQDKIDDLATIRSGAEKGATAVQPSAISDMATKTWVGNQGYLTAHQDISGKQDKLSVNTEEDYTGIILNNNEIGIDHEIIATNDYVDANITDTMNFIIQERDNEHAGRVAGDNLLQAQINNKADLVEGVVPSSQLPSYVDDVIEFTKQITGDDESTEEQVIALELGTTV